jgi:adenylosuccinate lyase
MVTVNELIKGYGDKFPSLDALFSTIPTGTDTQKLSAPTPALGRYYGSVAFLEQATSDLSVGKKRFEVLIEYFIRLGEVFDKYQGVHKDKKIVSNLSEDDKKYIRSLGKTPEDILQAQEIEKFTEHDTAAAGDYLKIRTGTFKPHLESMIEGFHFAITSEDVMSIVFGRTLNEVVYTHLVPAILDFEENLISYVNVHENNAPLILPGLTHKQAAEPTTLGKKVANTLTAINYHLNMMLDKDGKFIPFSGKMSGAIGNFTTHYAAYPDINWEKFAMEFVESFGLRYESMTNQAVSYAVEAQHFTTIANMLTHILKFTRDFVDMASCPAQFFVKKKKAGTKGSSIMPNKSNAWQQEGAQKMLIEARDMLMLYAKELPNYPHEGDMGRSYMMRNIATAFMPVFIGLDRIKKEIKNYMPNPGKIKSFLNEYPGMSGSAIQTMLKREGIPGDAYRAIEKIAINPDGSYANAEQFRAGLEKTMDELKLTPKLREELTALLEPANLVKKAHDMAGDSIYRETMRQIKQFREQLTPYAPRHPSASV